MPSILSKSIQNINAKHGALISSGLIITYLLKKLKDANTSRRNRSELVIQVGDKKAKKDKVAVDGVFFGRIWKILKILIPGVFTAETGYLVLVALSLICRTYCDVWMIQNGTMIESAIIGRDIGLFKKYLLKYFYAMPTIALVNNILKLGLSELKLRFRTQLTHHLYDKYLRGYTFYQMSNLDSRISNADQLLTQDVEKFCDSIAELYSNLSKPIMDIGIYAVKLTSAIGAQGPGYMCLYLVMSGLLLTRLRRPIGRMTVTEQQYEGEYRFVNSRLITNSEEIAFYQGNIKEKSTMYKTFQRLVDHLRNLIGFRFQMGIIDNIVAKYIATLVGYWVVSRPFLNLSTPQYLRSGHSELLEDYYKSGRMLVRMAEAIGRVVLAGREMTRLSGYTARIIELNQVLEDLKNGKYVRPMVNSSTNDALKSDAPLTDGSPNSENGFEVLPKKRLNLVPNSGKIIYQDHVIKFENVPLVTPNGDVLVEELNLEVHSGSNVIVCGPNGCGKSSLFRILGGLWPIFGGNLTKPSNSKLFYVPQRPYMPIGTLRDQVIYPDTFELMKVRGATDTELEGILEKVKLAYILEREGGWNVQQDWMDVLSGGEKQRIAMARLFYHRPQFAILDECTSAVSVDVEGSMYAYCKEIGVTLFTVSHRKSLWKYHEFYLHMDGRGAFEFHKITESTEEFGS